MSPQENLAECLRLLDAKDYFNGGQTVRIRYPRGSAERERIVAEAAFWQARIEGNRINAEFIAHARTDIPLLLAALDEARRDLEFSRQTTTNVMEALAASGAETAAAEARAAAADRVIEQVRALADVGDTRTLDDIDEPAVLIVDLRAILDRLATADADATEGEA